MEMNTRGNLGEPLVERVAKNVNTAGMPGGVAESRVVE